MDNLVKVPNFWLSIGLGIGLLALVLVVVFLWRFRLSKLLVSVWGGSFCSCTRFLCLHCWLAFGVALAVLALLLVILFAWWFRFICLYCRCLVLVDPVGILAETNANLGR